MKHTCLIVENDAGLLMVLRRTLENRAYITWTCPTPDIATSIFAAVRPRVVILNLDAEQHQAMGLIAFWRKMAPQTLIITCSATNSAPRRQEAMDQGANAFLVKPYPISDVFKLLDQLPPAFIVEGNQTYPFPAELRLKHLSDIGR